MATKTKYTFLGGSRSAIEMGSAYAPPLMRLLVDESQVSLGGLFWPTSRYEPVPRARVTRLCRVKVFSWGMCIGFAAPGTRIHGKIFWAIRRREFLEVLPKLGWSIDGPALTVTEFRASLGE